jgi:GAF domain-containing protein
MKSTKPFFFEEVGVSSECPIESFSFGSHICIPIIGTGNESFGILFSGSPLPKVFNNDEQQFLQYVTRSLALAIQRLQRMEELKKAVEMNSCVMAAYIGSSRSVAETYKAILEGTSTVLKADRVSLMIWDTGAGLLRTVDLFGPRSADEMTFVLQMGEGIAGRTLEKREPYWTTDLNDSKGKALLCLPLVTLRGEPLGVITATRIEKREAFAPAEIDTALTFATRAALAIENATLHQKEKNDLSSALKKSDDAKAA